MAATPLRHDLLQGAYEALYRDLLELIPSANCKSIEWDKIQLNRLVKNRGQRFVTIDLPEFGKVFERSLNLGALISFSIPGFARLRTRRGRDMRPRLFWAFMCRVFHYDGRLREQPCTSSILAIRRLCYLMKKVKGDCDDGFTFAATAELYGIEEKMDRPSLNWDDPLTPYTDGGDVSIDDSVSSDPELFADDHRGRWFRSHGAFYQRVFDLLVGLLPEFDSYHISGSHGPGAVSDGKKGTSKYSFPNWPDRLETVFPFDWHASSCFMQGEEYPLDSGYASKLAVVPKTQKGPRLIAAEPIANQWVQQGIARWFIRAFEASTRPGRILRESIRIDDQTLNQQMSRKASQGWGSTIDLSSASDRLSCYLVERVFRRKPELLSAMMACRTSILINDVDKKLPRLMKLRKFSTMGSALTFPVQTFVFYGIAVATLLRERGLQPSIKNWEIVSRDVAVYGDDIVIAASSSQALVSALQALGLKVNGNKTHESGCFRESCGTDWYNGECVTPTYIRSDFDPRRPATLSTIIETVNNFRKKGMRHVANFLLSRVPQTILRRIALWDGKSAVAGLYSAYGSDTSHLKRRWNRHLQRWEVKVIVLNGDSSSGSPDGIARLRQYFTEAPDSAYKWLKPLFTWDPKLIGRSTPVFRERYVPLYSGI